jgi:BirA family biotin operon repressor/biotin-[acetyl-CoA-carboxylase] ligase
MDRLDPAALALPGVEVRVVEQCGSTNTELLSGTHSGVTLLAAETQTAGRGRRGQRWESAAGAGLTFSVARSVARPTRELAALSLVAGVAAAKALRSLGVSHASLKWPNDLLAEGGKLGGILVETKTQGGSTLAVIGIGINYRRDAALGRRLRRPVACIEDEAAALPPRSRIIRRIVETLLDGLRAFDAQGLDAAREEWLALHAHAGQRVRVRLADGRTLSGIAAGLDGDGGLQLRTRAGIRAVHSGQVLSARAA